MPREEVPPYSSAQDVMVVSWLYGRGDEQATIVGKHLTKYMYGHNTLMLIWSRLPKFPSSTIAPYSVTATVSSRIVTDGYLGWLH